MTLKKRIFTGMGALAFIAVLVLNVQLVQNKTEDQPGSGIGLKELVANAQSGGEGGDCLEPGYCFGSGPDGCLVIQVTPQKLYLWAVLTQTCTPLCDTGGNLCCPVYITQGCCCAR